MTVGYVHPSSAYNYGADKRSVQQYIADRQAARHLSHNSSNTYREYAKSGVCILCRTNHISAHNHGYVIVFLFDGKMLTRITELEDGTWSMSQTRNVARWVATQRRSLIEGGGA